jgi:cytochrome c
MKAELIVVALGLALALSAHAQSRGELLYSTHCVACHTAKIHWRDGRAATDCQVSWPRSGSGRVRPRCRGANRMSLPSRAT